MDRVGLLPEEEEAFARIVSQLRGLGPSKVPWGAAAACVCVVAVGVAVGILVGLAAIVVLVYCATFILALSAGLLALALSDRRHRRR
jgi:hypothetical protein